MQKNLNESVHILQISDLHILSEPGLKMSGFDTESSFIQVLEHAVAHHPQINLILLTGDLAQNPCISSYQRILRILEKSQTRSICLPGNHDDWALMQQLINSKLVNCDQSIHFKHWQTICLNSKKKGSQGGYLASDELAFLATQLDMHPDINTLLAVHHHPVPTNSLWMDSMIIENRADLFSLLQNYPQVKAITCGHIHQELEIIQNNRIIFGSPSSCFQFEPNCEQYTLDNKNPGYRLIELHNNGDIQSVVYRVPLAK